MSCRAVHINLGAVQKTDRRTTCSTMKPNRRSRASLGTKNGADIRFKFEHKRDKTGQSAIVLMRAQGIVNRATHKYTYSFETLSSGCMICSNTQKNAQPRSQGLSSSRPRKRERGDPGWGWSRVSQNLGDQISDWREGRLSVSLPILSVPGMGKHASVRINLQNRACFKGHVKWSRNPQKDV